MGNTPPLKEMAEEGGKEESFLQGVGTAEKAVVNPGRKKDGNAQALSEKAIYPGERENLWKPLIGDALESAPT